MTGQDVGDKVAIAELLYRYAELIDAGDFDGVGELLGRGTFMGVGHVPLPKVPVKSGFSPQRVRMSGH
ncbi:hypothetical protein M2432_002339 [Mycobacterium sp. OTB74]|jgi:hypothetical protein|nr:hypothetical protein [Mycobacterium sp. OTB74]